MLQLSPSASEGIDTQLLSRQVSNDLEKGDDTVSSTQTNGSLTDQNQDILDDLDDDVSMSSVTNTPAKDQVDGQLHVNFKVDSLCDAGNTLLWDLIQEPNCVSVLFYALILKYFMIYFFLYCNVKNGC